jgi:DNA-directed RNA polymerase beta subunit
MLSFQNAKLYKIYNGFRFYNKPNAPFLITYMSENSSLLKDYDKLGISRVDIKNVAIPTTIFPRSFAGSEDRQIFKKKKLYVHSTKKLPPRMSVIIDMSKYIYLIDKQYKPKSYRQKYGHMIFNLANETFFRTPSTYEKILMYSVKVDDDFNDSYINRKIFLFMEAMKENTFPYDHLILCLTSNDKTYYRILIKDREFHFNRVKKYIKDIKNIDIEIELEKENDKSKLIDNIVQKINKKIDSRNEEILKTTITDFVEQNPEEAKEIVGDDHTNISDDDAMDLTSIAILVRNNNNVQKSKTMVQNDTQTPSDKMKAIEKKFVDEIIKPPKAVVDNDSELYKGVKIAETVDNIAPSHIFEKRKRDFSENLEKDIKLSFKALESKDVPLIVEKVKMIPMESEEWNLNKSDLSIIKVTLRSTTNKKHTITIRVPKIGDDGTFFINGKRKCIINQIIQLPIQFPKPFSAKFESSYSMFYIYSKHAKRNHLQIFMGTYKLSLAAIMFYGFGFEKTIQKFGIKYSIQDTKPSKDAKAVKIDGKHYVFTNIDSELKEQFINSFIQENWNGLTNENIELFSKEFFSKFIIRDTGRVNSVYLIQNNLDNIVDNISKGILASKGLPVNLGNIMYYMAAGAVDGYTIQRNNLDNQRIRSSEIISHILQKQIMTAHTKYKEQYLSGNNDAVLELPETQLISEFGMSEIVANMEYANPIEEISTMTRLSPIGKSIGGIPDKGAITTANRGLHESYLGNIDPIDTPEGAGVGITQQLTMGAAISTTRGLFSDNQKNVEKTEGLAVSPTAAMIPFMSNNDGNRVMFGCAQMKQAVPLKNPEPPVIQTGYESILTNDLSENFIKRSHCNGKVVKITNDEIIIKCNKTNKIEKIDIRPVHLESGAGRNTLSEFHVVVKEGQSIKEHQRLAEGGSVKDGFLSMGRNLCIAYMSWKGYNFEDGLVISDRLVKDKKMMSLHGIIVEINIGPKDKILEIVKIDDETKHGDVLIKKSIGDLDELLGLSDSDDDEFMEEFDNGQMIRKSPGGKIADIEIFCNENIEKYPEYVQYLIKRTNKNRKNPKQSYKNKHGIIKGLYIKFKINQEMNIQHGDKITNRYGGKGIVSLIEKEENMPITPWGDKVDIIANPIGVINRMNAGQLLETNIGMISKILAVNILKNKGSRTKVIALVKNVLIHLDKTKKQSMVTSIISNLSGMSKSSYDKFIKELEDHTFFPIVIPPYKSPTMDDIGKAHKALGLKKSYKLTLPEYGIKTMEDVAVGYIYYQKLEHIARLKLHSRSTGAVVSKTGQPTAGKRKGGGVRVGEADVYAFLSHNTTNIANELFGAMSDGADAKNEELSNILMNGHTEYVHPKSSQVGELLRCYFMAMMLSR